MLGLIPLFITHTTPLRPLPPVCARLWCAVQHTATRDLPLSWRRGHWDWHVWGWTCRRGRLMRLAMSAADMRAPGDAQWCLVPTPPTPSGAPCEFPPAPGPCPRIPAGAKIQGPLACPGAALSMCGSTAPAPSAPSRPDQGHHPRQAATRMTQANRNQNPSPNAGSNSTRYGAG